MTIDDILLNTINYLQAYNRSVTGVLAQCVPDLADYPTVIDSAALPYIITWPTQGSWHTKGQGGYPMRFDQTFDIICYVDGAALNSIPVRALEAIMLYQRLRNKYLLPSSVAVFNPTPTEPYQITLEQDVNSPFSDTGLRSDLVFSGKPYHGFILSVRARILVSLIA